jgi:acetyltransferase-like isoleucine patch superfamily enzyme
MLILFYFKVFHKANGWKYFFGSFNCFRIYSGAISISSGTWIEQNSLINCVGGNVKLGERFFMNRNSVIVSSCSITIGNDVLIANGVSIYDHDHTTIDPNITYGKQGYVEAPVVIGDNVWVGCHSVILKGVTIGKGSVIAAGSVVTKSIPEREIWGGIPAKFIKHVE